MYITKVKPNKELCRMYVFIQITLQIHIGTDKCSIYTYVFTDTMLNIDIEFTYIVDFSMWIAGKQVP